MLQDSPRYQLPLSVIVYVFNRLHPTLKLSRVKRSATSKINKFFLAQDGKKGLISYDDPRAEKYLQSIVDELDNLKIVRKV